MFYHIFINMKIVITEQQFKNIFENNSKEQLTEKCWSGYKQKGMKTMFGKRYPNCVKNESEETNEDSSPAQQAAIAINMKKKGIAPKNKTLHEDEYGSVEETNFVVGDLLTEAEYQGRKVQLGKPFLTPKGPKKRSVYVKNEKGNVVKVNFGDPNMRIKAYSPKHRKSFRARHNCQNPGPRTSAKFWSCRQW